jgi:hypothetical protein
MVMENTTGHGLNHAPFDLVPARDLSSAFVRRVRSPSAARCFSPFSSCDSCLFAREFVRRSFLVRGAATLCRDCALRLRIHCRESAWCLATDATGAARVRCLIISTSAHRASVSAHRSARPPSAPLVHSALLGVRLVCHYPSLLPRFRLCDVRGFRHPSSKVIDPSAASGYWVLVRKPQAAISGRGRTPPKPVWMWISSLLSRV